MKDKIKILTTSVVAWNDHIGGDSLSTLLKDFDAEQIANIYIRPELPNSPVCRKCLQITENDIIKSILKRDYTTAHRYNGTEKNTEQTNKNVQAEKKLYKKFKKVRWYIFLLARELIWLLGKWKSNVLDDFIDEFSPDIVLYSVDPYMHMNRITRYAIKRSGAKAIAIVWDDNFTYKTDPKTPGYLLHRFLLRRSFKKTINLADTIFSFTPKCQKELEEEMGISSILLTKPMQNIPRPETKLHYPIQMVYTGNLMYGREDTLVKMAKAFSILNKNGIRMTLDVYTNSEVSSSNSDVFNHSRGVTIHGVIAQDEAFEKQKNADVLLFLEALSGSKRHVARLSFSTKLTDYFSMGKCIFAVGPSDIAPIEYLTEHQAGFIVTNEQDILPALEKMVSDPATIVSVADKVYQTGIENHSEEKIRKRFTDALIKQNGGVL